MKYRTQKDFIVKKTEKAKDVKIYILNPTKEWK